MKSLKQLLRTPMKTCLFFLLMTAATALLVLGANLWAQTQAQMDAVEKQFTTLGTVEQKPNRTQMRTGWDAADGAYYSEAEPVYDSVISADVLDFDGANYLKAPEKRPYYLADLQGLAVRDGGTALFYPVVEFTPAETAVPDHPHKSVCAAIFVPGSGKSEQRIRNLRLRPLDGKSRATGGRENICGVYKCDCQSPRKREKLH